MRTLLSALVACVSVLQLACTGAATATPAVSPLAVVRAHLEAENAHDVERILATLADSVEFRTPSSSGRGQSVFSLDRAGQWRTYERAVSAAPKSHFKALDQIVSGPLVVSREQATGLPGGVREVGLTVYRVVGGRIVAVWILNTEGAIKG